MYHLARSEEPYGVQVLQVALCSQQWIGVSEILMHKEEKHRMRFTEEYESNIHGGFDLTPTYSPTPEVWAHFLSMQTTAVLQADPTGCSNNRRWLRGILMTSRIPGWNKSHRKTLHDPVDLCKVLTRLRWGCFVTRVCQTLTRCSQPSHSSGTFFSAVSLLTDVNYAENAAAMFLKAVDRNTFLKKTQMPYSVTKDCHCG